MIEERREYLGRCVRLAWVEYCKETGDTKPSHVAPWEELSEWDKEADRRIAEAVAVVVTTRIVQQLENMAYFGIGVQSPLATLMDAARRIRELL